MFHSALLGSFVLYLLVWRNRYKNSEKSADRHLLPRPPDRLRRIQVIIYDDCKRLVRNVETCALMLAEKCPYSSSKGKNSNVLKITVVQY